MVIDLSYENDSQSESHKEKLDECGYGKITFNKYVRFTSDVYDDNDGGLEASFIIVNEVNEGMFRGDYTNIRNIHSGEDLFVKIVWGKNNRKYYVPEGDYIDNYGCEDDGSIDCDKNCNED